MLPWVAERRRARAAAERSAAALLAAADARTELLDRVLQGFSEGIVVVDPLGRGLVRYLGPVLPAAVGAHAVLDGVIVSGLDSARNGVHFEQELDLAGPPRRTYVVRATPLALGGAAAYVRDVSESRTIDRMRRDFVANVSHELKTPIGALTLLGETMEHETDPTVLRRLAGHVLVEATRMERMVVELLDLSTIEALPDVERTPHSVGTMLAGAVDRAQAASVAADVTISVEADAGLEVPCDERLVVSALFNLIDNAVKYSDPGGIVRVQAHGTAEVVEVSVTDAGIGIPAVDQERVFERFYRVDRARARSTGGTGLGLSIVRHVAELHGGAISVESIEGHGSTFTLSLPR